MDLKLGNVDLKLGNVDLKLGNVDLKLANPAETSVPVGIVCLFCNSNENCLPLLEAGSMFESTGVCKALKCAGMEKVLVGSFFCPLCINDLKILLELENTLEIVKSQMNSLHTGYENKLQQSLNLDLENGSSSTEKGNRQLLLEAIRTSGLGTVIMDREDQAKPGTNVQQTSKTGYLVHESNVISVTAYLNADQEDDSDISDSSSDESEDSSEETEDSSSHNDESCPEEELEEDQSKKESPAEGDRPAKRPKMDEVDEELKSRYKLRDLSVRVKRCEREISGEPLEKSKPGRKISSSTFPCLITGCKKKYSQKDSRDNHITRYHLGMLAHRCSSCPEAFKSWKGLRKHQKIHRKTKFVCQECAKEFQTTTSLNRHRRKHETRKNMSNKTIICEHKGCDQEFKDKISYFVHVRRDHLEMEKPHECRICRLKFGTASELEEHINIHNDVTPHVCSLCELEFPTNLLLEKHVKHYHEEEKIQCVFCYRFFADKNEFKEHLLSHLNERQHVCEFCGLACLRESTLRDHILLSHPEANLEFPTCKICNKTFKTDKFLQEHIRLHTGEFRFLCDKCSYGSMQKSHLVKHMETHRTDWSYACDLCSKKFNTKDNLRSHRRCVHDSNKPFPCPICFRRFVKEDQLQRHSDKHHGTKNKEPIRCTLCKIKRTFVYESSFKKHLSSAHGVNDETPSNSTSIIEDAASLCSITLSQDEVTLA